MTAEFTQGMDVLGNSEPPCQAEPPCQVVTEVSENAESLCQMVYEVASALFRNNADWATFHREVLGLEGIVRRCFSNPEQLAAFERTETYAEIQRMLCQLRRRANATPSREGAPVVVMIRVPKSLQEVLRAEAYERRTSMNKLCISKLLQLNGEEAPPPCQAVTEVSENAEPLCQMVYEVASALFRNNAADWGTFHREVFGLKGIVRRYFPTREQLAAFERTETYAKIQRMLCQLRDRATGTPSREGSMGVITIRVPKSVQDVLRAEADERRTSMNKLCISKLLQFIDEELVPSNLEEDDEEVPWKKTIRSEEMGIAKPACKPGSVPASNGGRWPFL